MLNYASYLKLPQLFELQTPISVHKRAELIFIITHQAMELWLKVLLEEIENLYKLFRDTSSHTICLINGLDHCCQYWRVMVTQFDGIRALSPLEFFKFREVLGSASGSQSEQYKRLERYLGFQASRSTDLDFKIAVTNFLHYQARKLIDADSSCQNLLLQLYQKSHEHEILMDKLIEFDEWFGRWKSEHVKLVKRMIGSTLGTAGSTSLELAKKIDQPIFDELWKIRAQL